MDLKFNKALVTGGAGFIGSHLVDALLTRGGQVTVIDDLSSGHWANLEHVKDRITFYQGDIRDQALLVECVRDCQIIFHQAAVVSVPQTVANPIESAMVNDMGTLFLLEAARKNNVKRVVLASSCAVYGDDPELPKNENMNLKPQSPYAVQKLSNELNARLYHELYGLETVCLRYFNVYGPRQDPSSPYSGVISIFLTKAASVQPPYIYGDGNQYRDFIFVKDVVKANLLAAVADDAAGQVFNIGTGSFVRISQLWKMICDMSGLDMEPLYESFRPGDIRESVANIDRAEKVFEFKPDYAFQRGLQKTFEWYNRRNQ